MSWNYRVVKSKTDLRIFDVYYDDAGAPIATHDVPTYVYGETLAELRAQLELMLEALDEPILDEAEIGSGSARE